MAPRKPKRPTLPTFGERGDELQPIQRRLNAAGAGRLAIDGRFTSAMRRAILRYQGEHDLDQTGELDAATLRSLG